VAAINTARLSANKVKLNPRPNCLEIKTVLPDKTKGISLKERIKEVRTKTKARIFLSLEEILPTTGRQNAPITGTKIMVKSNRS
jgi:hypothetical protein